MEDTIEMSGSLPIIIQGGMGAGISHGRLANAVSRLGQLGVVSGTALDEILSRRLQDGDADGSVRRAMGHFPFRNMARRILDTHFIPGGRKKGAPYRTAPMHSLQDSSETLELCIAGNFVEVFLAREDHPHPVGINFLEKIQFPHLPSLYGAMLAGVAVVIVGAGIPIEFPAAMAELARHQPTTYPVSVRGPTSRETRLLHFEPARFHEHGTVLPELRIPLFYPIVSSDALASILHKRLEHRIDGFIVEGPLAGGHNAPPRGSPALSADGQPVYGPRDVVSLERIQKLGLPFWLAGAYGSPERLREARAAGATGVQVGTPFALCAESGLAPQIRRELILAALAGKARIFTDPLASPTGFPFKVADLGQSLSEPAVYEKRRRRCDLGFLREAYLRDDGLIGYRCPAESVAAFTAKGGLASDSIGRKCLCNALVSNLGMPQELADGQQELPLVTLGDDLSGICRFCTAEHPEFTAADVLRILLQG
jgi:nitronate monooxygenase